jgi:hypothetical protein
MRGGVEVITRAGRSIVLALALALIASPALGQGAGSTTSLSGVVQDKDGGAVPGAAVVLVNTATKATVAQTVTNGVGLFTFPAIDAGTYTVTITLQGFKTSTIPDIRILAATPRTLGVTKLELGAITETVEVRSNSELVRTETPTVSSTVSTELIQNLPRADRNVLNFLQFLPGVETPGDNARNSTISGLPQRTINISIDGVNTGNNLQSGDGFFSLVVPRQDAVEEVTLTSAAAGADSSGQGAAQIRFVTRSGTNQYQTSLYNYFQHKALNGNTFFNTYRLVPLPRPDRTNLNYGGRIGGPIVIPGLVDGRGKAFFFFNQEETWSPIDTSRTRTILQETARNGLYRSNTVAGLQWDILGTVAAFNAANGTNHRTALDPTVGLLLSAIRASTTACPGPCSITTVSTDNNRESFAWFVPNKGVRHSPTGRVDVNLTARHRVSGTYYWQFFNNTPDTLNGADPKFPGFPAFGDQRSYRTTGSATFRSTFSSNLVNEVLTGWQWSPVGFFDNATPAMFENQGGFHLGENWLFGLTGAADNAAAGPQVRNTYNWNVDDTLNWLKGSHNLRFGASFTRLDNTIDNFNTVNSVSLGFNTTFDPAAQVFNSTNFPGATSGNLSDMRALYALMTGRVTQLPGTGRLNAAGTEYIFNGHGVRRERQDEYGFFAQDTWRWKPNLTVTLGVRYQLQMPVQPVTGSYSMSTLADLCGPAGLGDRRFGGRQCNLFNPFGQNGIERLQNPGVIPQYVRYDPGNPGYDVDYNNFGPNVGASWRPNIQGGFLRTILGDPDQATISGGYTRSFNRERFDQFTTIYANNPGLTTSGTRSYTGVGEFNLLRPGETGPFLLSDCVGVAGNGRCTQPTFAAPAFPIIASFAAGNDIRIFDPDIQVPYTDSWAIGLQRAITRDMVVEVRYTGNVNRQPWNTENWNEENIIENGFLDEFRVAMSNLQANVEAGRGATFAFMGQGTGTSPLPIYLAHFSGRVDAGNPAAYTSTNFTNSSFVNDLNPFSPDPYGAAGNFSGNTFRPNMAAANALGGGFPDTFWVLNTLVDSAIVQRNRDRNSENHAFILNMRRRLARGLTVQGSYEYKRNYRYTILNNDFHNDLFKIRDSADNDYIPHAIKLLWVYQVPVGRGKRFGANWNRWIDGALGGWEFSGAGRAQIEQFRLTNTVLVGMSRDEAQQLFSELRFSNDANSGAPLLHNMPEDVVRNTILAFDADPTQPGFYAPGSEPTGRYFAPATCAALPIKDSDCAAPLFFNSSWFAEFDFRIVKKFSLPRRATFEFAAELFNALSAKNFNQNMNPTSGDPFRITSTGSGARIGQLVWRVTW